MLLADMIIKVTRVIKLVLTKSTTKVPPMARAFFLH